jgi:hypothetical protein
MGKIDMGNEPKINKLAVQYGDKKVNKAIRVNWASSASSAVQSFKWLMLNHALPVGDRMTEKVPCPVCGGTETIEHTLYHCKFAKEVWKIISRQWGAKISETGMFDNAPEERIMPGGGFWQKVCLGRKNTSFPRAWGVVQSITAFHIWRTRCAALYCSKVPPPPEKEAPFIWQHVYLTLRAELEALKDIERWWIIKTSHMNPRKAEVALKKVMPPLLEDMGILDALLKTLTHPSQVAVEDREDGCSNTVLPYRNRYSNPYWYTNIVEPSMVEPK